MAGNQERLRPLRNPPRRRGGRRRRHLPLDTLFRRIGAALGVPLGTIQGPSQSRRTAEARQLLAYVWTECLGRRASELAAALGRTRSNVSWAARRGAEGAKAYAAAIKRWCR